MTNIAFPCLCRIFIQIPALYLLDTYDITGSGVPNAIRVFEEKSRRSYAKALWNPFRQWGSCLSYKESSSRIMLDEAGFPDAACAASGDLDENLITSLKSQGAPITSWVLVQN